MSVSIYRLAQFPASITRELNPNQNAPAEATFLLRVHSFVSWGLLLKKDCVMPGYYGRLIAKSVIPYATKLAFKALRGSSPWPKQKAAANRNFYRNFVGGRGISKTSFYRKKKRMMPYRARKRRGYRRSYKRFRRGYNRTSGYYGRYNGTRAGSNELKFFDLGIAPTVLNLSGNIFSNSINEIVQGTTETERIGRKCTIRNIAMRISLELPAQANTALPVNDTVRVVLYLDKQCNGAAATVLNIVETSDFQSYRNLSNTGRFRILSDREYTLNPIAAHGADATAEWGPVRINDSVFLKTNIPLEFSGTTGLIGTIRSNNIGIMTLSKLGTITTLEVQTRIRFSG